MGRSQERRRRWRHWRRNHEPKRCRMPVLRSYRDHAGPAGTGARGQAGGTHDGGRGGRAARERNTGCRARRRFEAAQVDREELEAFYADIPFGLPEEPTPKAGVGASRAFSVDGYGFSTWDKLFSSRQLLALGAIVRNIRGVQEEIEACGYAGRVAAKRLSGAWRRQSAGSPTVVAPWQLGQTTTTRFAARSRDLRCPWSGISRNPVR